MADEAIKPKTEMNPIDNWGNSRKLWVTISGEIDKSTISESLFLENKTNLKTLTKKIQNNINPKIPKW